MPDVPTWHEVLPAPLSPYDFDSINASILISCAEKYDWSQYARNP